MTIREALAEGSAVLSAAGIDAPGLDASLLLAETLRLSRSSLLAAGPEPLPEKALAAYRRLVERRLAGECTAYILGRKEFWGLEFTVSPAVLVPRPDTETLVEAALEVVGSGECAPSILDLCTGSGAVAVALKYERPGARVWASDISGEALDIARHNVERLLGKSDPPAVALLKGDLFEALDDESCRFDLITANPPYVPAGMMGSLPLEVRREPALALDGGADGLVLIRRIVAGAAGRLHPGGILLMEADPGQMAVIAELLAAQGCRRIRVYQDLAGRDRVIASNF